MPPGTVPPGQMQEGEFAKAMREKLYEKSIPLGKGNPALESTLRGDTYLGQDRYLRGPKSPTLTPMDEGFSFGDFPAKAPVKPAGIPGAAPEYATLGQELGGVAKKVAGPAAMVGIDLVVRGAPRTIEDWVQRIGQWSGQVAMMGGGMQMPGLFGAMDELSQQKRTRIYPPINVPQEPDNLPARAGRR